MKIDDKIDNYTQNFNKFSEITHNIKNNTRFTHHTKKQSIKFLNKKILKKKYSFVVIQF